jgi:molecular chaperone HtpG
MDQFHFKVNLKGMIDLLSNHLYSTPEVFVRELVQNAVDAITARVKAEPEHRGCIGLELFSSSGTRPTLYIEDNGIGLTEEEVHHFLAQIGQTSKNKPEDDDFIGRFGVGLLSCFIVSNEIVLLTRSIQSQETIEWRGKPDGSYSVRKSEKEMKPGTRIFLQSKPGMEHYFAADKVKAMVRHYGEFLPYELMFYGENDERLNTVQAPWNMSSSDALLYGQKKWEQAYLAAIPLSSPLGDASGVAYILPHAVRANAKRRHRVYVKNMLLSESVEHILPEWSFFVMAVVNVNGLKPTASREELSLDGHLELVQQELGACIKRYLLQLQHTNPSLLEQLIQTHYDSLKFLAQEDDELYALFIDWLPFTTSLGRLTMSEIRKHAQPILYTPHMDEFRQMNQVAKAQSLCVVNTAYVYDTQLIEKMPLIFPDVGVQQIDPKSFTHRFQELTVIERERAYAFIQAANRVLQPYRCSAAIKKFQPDELPALYTADDEALFLRTAEQTQEESNDLFAAIIDHIAVGATTSKAQLCFNWNNHTIQKALEAERPEIIELIVEMLYVQSLLLGHYPLKKQEYHLLNKGLTRVIEQGLE